MNHPIKGKIEFEPAGPPPFKKVTTGEAIFGLMVIGIVLFYTGVMDALPDLISFIVSGF